MSDHGTNDERPAKRQRLTPSDSGEQGAIIGTNGESGEMNITAHGVFLLDPKEIEVGITEFVSDDVLPFQGLLKKRYTDFLVNEILPDGEVVHLTDTSAPKEFQPSASGRRNARKNENHGAVSKEFASEKLKTEIAVDNSGSNSGESATKAQPPLKPLETGEISDNDRQQLVSFLNEQAVVEIINLNKHILDHPNQKPKDHPTVRTEFTDDRSVRTEIHSAIRRIFSSRIETSTDKDGFLCLMAGNPKSRNSRSQQNGDGQHSPYPGKLGWLARGGEYLHFTLYKENKDTMEVVSFLTRMLKINAKAFQFAGTKDRRAVTAQRVSAHRLDVDRLVKQNQYLRNAAVGNFEYKPSGLELGDLGGNEFVLTLRECDFANVSNPVTEDNLVQIQSTLDLALRNLHNNGYLNYYGLQRFGTFSTRTDTVGVHILKGDFRSACEDILKYNSESLAAADKEPESEVSTPNQGPHIGPGRDEILRAKAIHLFQTTGTSHNALEILPRKFTAENQIIRHLARIPTDYIGALLAIPRNLRLMYVHAYQSLVWNKAVTNRWKTHGNKVTEGDLVLIKEHKDKEPNSSPTNTTEPSTIDADGEIIITPSAHDRSTQLDDAFDRARALTAAEAASGAYTIFDIVLPLPGYDILYPANASGAFYKTFMASEDGGGLDPYDMRRKHRDFSLSGGYRKMLASIRAEFSVAVHAYARDEEQFVMTDLERVGAAEGKEMMDVVVGDGGGEKEVKDKVAAVLKFQLGASQYATMALRELSRGGVVGYKADASGGR